MTVVNCEFLPCGLSAVAELLVKLLTGNATMFAVSQVNCKL